MDATSSQDGAGRTREALRRRLRFLDAAVSCAHRPARILWRRLHLSDATVDLVGEGFDCALRIASLPDSSLTARRLKSVKRHLVASPDYLEQRGRPTHPDDLRRHACLGYAYLPTGETWRLVHESGQEVVVRPVGPLRANNSDALTGALCAGLGIAPQPDFIYWRDVVQGRLETVMTDWGLPPISLHLVAPGGGRRPARVTALMDYLTKRYSTPLWPGRG